MSLEVKSDLAALVAALEVELKGGWVGWPGGYPSQVELALIDAVFSIRAKYGTARTETRAATGVQAVVGNWRNYRAGDADDLTAIARHDPDAFLGVCGNRSQISGRTKSSAVQEAANKLVEVGVCTSADFGPRQQEARKAYVGVRGLGDVTFNYLRMLLGYPDVKADVWIIRFVEGALGRTLRPPEVSALMHQAADVLADRPETGMPTTLPDLDHAVWHSQRRRLARP